MLVVAISIEQRTDAQNSLFSTKIANFGIEKKTLYKSTSHASVVNCIPFNLAYNWLNYHTSLDPILCKIWYLANAPYKLNDMFSPTLLTLYTRKMPKGIINLHVLNDERRLKASWLRLIIITAQGE